MKWDIFSSFLSTQSLFVIITKVYSINTRLIFMRSYELALVIKPDIDSTKLKEINDKVEELVKGEKGKIGKKDSWDKKELTYPIQKEKEAKFVFFNFETEALSREFGSKIKTVDGVLRFLLLKK